MKVKVYFGFTKTRNSYNFSNKELYCVSLDRKVVTKRMSRLIGSYHTEIKVRTLDTDNPELLKYLC